MEINKIYNMDNIDGMKQMIEEGIQVDSIVTDPPYNLSFMNKSWDSVGTPKEFQRWNERWAELAYQILKPGGYLVVFGGTRTYHRMVSGVEDAGFEICDTLEWIYGCLSEDTEILTLDGWKGINEISSDDKVFSYNYESQKNRKNRVGISNVNHVFKYDIEDEMVHLVNDNTDQLLTKNHKVLCKTKNREQIDGERTTYDSNVDYRYVDAGQIRKNSRVTLPLGTIYDGEKSIGGKLFSELVGLVLAEGWYQNKAVNISQSSVNADIVSRIRYILGKLNADYSEYKRDRTYKERNYIEHQFYITGDVANKIQSLIPNKKPTWDLLHISLSEKEHLYKGLMDGDGNWSHKTFYQNDNKFLEWFQILCHLMGKQARINKNKMCVSVHDNSTTEIQAKHRKNDRVKYKGKVWCINTDIGNFFARRNGKIFITGNSGFPKSYNISKGFDKQAGVEREVIGTKGDMPIQTSGRRNTEDSAKVDKFERKENNITKPATEKAKEWEGWGTALKPAHEPIVLAQKPREGTYCNNIEKYSCGGINIDDCRNGTSGARNNGRKKDSDIYGDFGSCEKVEYNKGRFPANLLLTHHPDCECIGEKKVKGTNQRDEREDIDDKALYGNSRKSGLGGFGDENGLETVEHWNCVEGCPIRIMDEQSGVLQSGDCPNGFKGEYTAEVYGKYENNMINPETIYADKGGASRYFNNFKWQDEDFFLYTAKVSKSERTCDGNVDNSHPTVKPIELIRWLIRLVTPKDGITVDLFCGSGTHPCASYLEKIDFIAFEKEEEYWEIANNRYEYYKSQPVQISLF